MNQQSPIVWLAVVIFLGVATVCVVCNRQLAEYFAENFLKILQFVFPRNLLLKHYLLWGYRILLYVAAAFCVLAVAIYLFI